jgi:NAD(P)-dependent dehydrogenase (short-subunit alcohol dehydrogenase family)
MNLSGKVALVTGGTMGIGRAIAVDLARGGADVAIVARHLDGPARETSQAIEALGRRCTGIAGDLTQRDDCVRAVAETIEAFGRLDVIVHNAGGPSPGRIDQIDAAQWQATLDLHVSALFHLCQTAIPHLRKNKEGVIITVGSTAGILGVEGAIAYAVAKGAIPHFTRCLARELAGDNIRVNCIAPGVIRTRFHDDMTEERRQLNLEKRIPLRSEGTPEQVAEAVRTLVTNDYITGETLVIDGGLTSRIC